MTIDNARFRRQAREIAAQIKEQNTETFRITAVKLLRAVIQKTPVDTGRLRANWQVGVSFRPTGEVGGFDKGGAYALLAGRRLIAQAYIGSTIYIVNNLPYAPIVEYGLYPNPPKGGKGKTVGGYSTQAPQGMVRITVQEFGLAVQEAVQEAKQGAKA